MSGEACLAQPQHELDAGLNCWNAGERFFRQKLA